ncbi:MAG: hypothetical protein ABIL58_20435 [Pseudomonadota bacterium]
MKVRSSLPVVVLTAVLVVMSVGIAAGQDTAVEQVSDYGTIDWVGEKLTAVGLGAPVNRQVGPAQMRILAQRAAVVVARRNLLEVVKGVHIDSTSRLENFVLKDDTIESRVSGVLVNSTVDKIDYLNDGSAKAWVSIPLSGELREMLLRVAVQAPAPGSAPETARIDERLDRLERRIMELEQQVGGLRKTNAAYKEMVHRLQEFVVAWVDYSRSRPLVLPAAMDNTDTAAIDARLARQELQLNALSARLEDMTHRLEIMENAGSRKTAPATTKSQVKFTGLVIDARGLGFRPCLKPEIYGKEVVLYPGDYIDLNVAVSGGYVRYYRDLAKAQQNERVGTLPMTIKAVGTQSGDRNLTINPADFDLLREISAIQGSFLGQCRIIIVF